MNKGVVRFGSELNFALFMGYTRSCILEGLLAAAADNAVVMAVMVRHLPPEQRKKALFYGLLGAFIFRFIALFLISIIANFWFIQAAGAVYLILCLLKIYGISSIVKMKLNLKVMIIIMMNTPLQFWGTVLKVEFADIAFAIDSMLAAMAIAVQHYQKLEFILVVWI